MRLTAVCDVVQWQHHPVAAIEFTMLAFACVASISRKPMIRYARFSTPFLNTMWYSVITCL